MINAAWMQANNSYLNDRELFDHDMAPLVVLTRKDGPWADVSAKDRIWILTRPGFFTPSQMAAWLNLISLRRGEPAPTHHNPAACCAFANGAANIAYSRNNQSSDAYDREVEQQLADAILILTPGPRGIKLAPGEEVR